MFSLFSVEFWIILALIFLILELSTNTFYLLALSLSLFVTALVCYLDYGIIIQFLVFIVSSIVFVILLRPLSSRINLNSSKKSNSERLIGLNASVVKVLGLDKYNVLVDNEVWLAVSEDNLEKGDNVIVRNIEGVKLVVKKV